MYVKRNVLGSAVLFVQGPASLDHAPIAQICMEIFSEGTLSPHLRGC